MVPLARVLMKPAACRQAGGQQVRRPLSISVITADGEALGIVEQRGPLPLLGGRRIRKASWRRKSLSCHSCTLNDLVKTSVTSLRRNHVGQVHVM